MTTAVKTPLERSRGKAKQSLIAHGYHIAHTLKMTAATIEGRLWMLTEHQITEWDALSGIHQDCMTMYAELGLTELVQKYVQFQLVHFTARPDDEIDLDEIGGKGG